jgi:hypothetical protein
MKTKPFHCITVIRVHLRYRRCAQGRTGSDISIEKTKKKKKTGALRYTKGIKTTLKKRLYVLCIILRI